MYIAVKYSYLYVFTLRAPVLDEKSAILGLHIPRQDCYQDSAGGWDDGTAVHDHHWIFSHLPRWLLCRPRRLRGSRHLVSLRSLNFSISQRHNFQQQERQRNLFYFLSLFWIWFAVHYIERLELGRSLISDHCFFNSGQFPVPQMEQ